MPRAGPLGDPIRLRVGSRALSPEALAVLTPDRPHLPAILLVFVVFALRLSLVTVFEFLLHD